MLPPDGSQTATFCLIPSKRLGSAVAGESRGIIHNAVTHPVPAGNLFKACRAIFVSIFVNKVCLFLLYTSLFY